MESNHHLLLCLDPGLDSGFGEFALLIQYPCRPQLEGNIQAFILVRELVLQGRSSWFLLEGMLPPRKKKKKNICRFIVSSGKVTIIPVEI